MSDPRFGTFFLPGPTEVRAEVLAAMNRPTISHRGKAFESMFATIQAGLAELFLTARPVYVMPASGTGAMEAAVRNVAQGKILSLVNGGFSERFADVAESCGHAVTRLTVDAGETFELDRVEQALRGGGYAAVTFAHSETSTGVVSPVRELAALARTHGALSLVDSVSGMGGAELCTDAWGLDFVFTASQKALAIPAGLAFAVASPEYLERAKQSTTQGRYFDVAEFERFSAKHQTPTTPALHLLYALDVQLRNIHLEGIERRWERHLAMRAATEAWVARVAERHRIPLRVLAREGARSPTVTAIVLPERVSPSQIVEEVSRRGYVIGGGQPPVGKTTIRIGHMGDHTTDGLAFCLAAVEEALAGATRFLK
ncbi:MAG TPA: alanine--glyoxylate aminotransferase family protein [Gemmatimonadaceae bacterium]|nr:alanine--glyoxylate aminotransferase family protein [Gemmatimonadaceae bacterium]